ncbi:hypothetical protein [Mycolicibacterium brumae]|uniref:Uncharacterized protein n=1 Tax=Mycolicibacterium brumae TaxID=85968 RepID=A0A2G5PFJ8_9MYCO|nr:hypothetical protein [Mycolicibacterium brumae]MCV7192636.1 hypothetical protein [Mycolicibacterium brumae]PIB77076.1 hypothetical protein CQY22_002095 [Mycolicibacterium brumae]RWA18372.1 hypothetical protein MBRU_03935 [Mycolicibacterium brumae DSM 44177]UWW10406.1 hypothetical protein L2Z93_003535 [Mycolicibacterium brumae]
MTDDPQPWHRTKAAVYAAGGLGLILVVALFVLVVRMSGQWESPDDNVKPPEFGRMTANLPSSSESLLTSTESTTSYTTAPISTTEIGLETGDPADPSGADVSGTSASGEPDEDAPTTATTRPRGAEADDEESEITTTRKRARYNETRILTPGP